MLLKVLFYAYTKKIYSPRKIAAALRENIHYTWLSGGNRPDFRRINRFRGKRLAETIQEMFAILVLYLESRGYIDLSPYVTDGTKIESIANKYSFVWKKSTTRYQWGVIEKVKELFEKIDQLNEEEDLLYGDNDPSDTMWFISAKVIADAGFSSEENYVYLESKNLETFDKYNTFDHEQ